MSTESLTSTTDLAQQLRRYFCSFLINQRRVSKHTINSYRDTFRLFLPYIASQGTQPISSLKLTDINAEIVRSFLQHLEQNRENKIQTRNARLSAIRSFLRYAAIEVPEALADIQPVLAIPDKKVDRFIFEYLDKAEIEALLQVQDLTTWFGRRDHALLLTLYNTGARVSEAIQVRIEDVDLHRQNTIHLYGKGRKERIVPLWSHTIAILKKWQAEQPPNTNAPMFPNRRGEAITRFGVKQRLDCAVKSAIKICPSLKGRKITPHSIRHTTAMHLLQSGVDLTVIALWLGHEKIETTHQYMAADIEMKRKALAKLPTIDSQDKSSPVTLSEDILAFLESL